MSDFRNPMLRRPRRPYGPGARFAQILKKHSSHKSLFRKKRTLARDREYREAITSAVNKGDLHPKEIPHLRSYFG